VQQHFTILDRPKCERTIGARSHAAAVKTRIDSLIVIAG